jgi:hypothetical protein
LRSGIQAHSMETVALIGPFNAFGHLLLKHCEQRGLALSQLIERAGLKSPSRVYYAIRPLRSKGDHAATGRATPLTEAEMVTLSRALHLSVEAEEELVITAQLERAPDRLRKYIRRLERK